MFASLPNEIVLSMSFLGQLGLDLPVVKLHSPDSDPRGRLLCPPVPDPFVDAPVEFDVLTLHVVGEVFPDILKFCKKSPGFKKDTPINEDVTIEGKKRGKKIKSTTTIKYKNASQRYGHEKRAQWDNVIIKPPKTGDLTPRVYKRYLIQRINSGKNRSLSMKLSQSIMTLTVSIQLPVNIREVQKSRTVPLDHASTPVANSNRH